MTITARSRWNRANVVYLEDAAGALVRRPYSTPVPNLRRVQYPDDRIYQLKEGDTWSRLARSFLGDSYLWWVIPEWNGVLDPLLGLRDLVAAGATIRIPTVTRVQFEILNARRKAQG